jgi:hypothetical protein
MRSGLEPPAEMTVAEFLASDTPGPGRWQLVDDEQIATAPDSRTHGALQFEFWRVIGNHLVASGRPCTVVRGHHTICIKSYAKLCGRRCGLE